MPIKEEPGACSVLLFDFLAVSYSKGQTISGPIFPDSVKVWTPGSPNHWTGRPHDFDWWEGVQIGKTVEPRVKVTILPSVYDPERYRRGIDTLNRAFSRALASRLRSHANTEWESGEDHGL